MEMVAMEFVGTALAVTICGLAWARRKQLAKEAR